MGTGRSNNTHWILAGLAALTILPIVAMAIGYFVEGGAMGLEASRMGIDYGTLDRMADPSYGIFKTGTGCGCCSLSYLGLLAGVGVLAFRTGRRKA